jgi:hypothetical protein
MAITTSETAAAVAPLCYHVIEKVMLLRSAFALSCGRGVVGNGGISRLGICTK